MCDFYFVLYLKKYLTILNLKILHTSKSTLFQKNILLMLKGTFIAQTIGVIGSLIIAKVYGSEAYGIFGLFISISSVLKIINTFQLDKTIVTLQNENESKNLMNSLFVITLFLSLTFIIIYKSLSLIFNLNSINFSILILSILASIIFSFNIIHESFLTFRKKFHPISNAKIYMAFFNIIFQLLLFHKFKLMGLIYGNIISISLISIYYFIKNHYYLSNINFQQLKKSITSNSSVIKYLFPSSLINSLAINLMPILIVAFFSLKETGEYFLSLKILATPLFLISSSISQVYYQKSSEMLHTSKEKLFNFTKKIVLINLVLMLLFIIVINTVGIFFLELFFNKNWENLRLFTFILSFLILAKSSFNPISNIIIVLHKNHISLLFNCYLLIINLMAIYIGYTNSNILQTIIILSLFGSFGYIVLLLYFMNELKKLKNNYG
ncbi:lipopolysaccharide biosynthesis protein [Lutibacter sp.]